MKIIRHFRHFGKWFVLLFDGRIWAWNGLENGLKDTHDYLQSGVLSC
jgi:hypothetical protein